jgi:putative membrane protein
MFYGPMMDGFSGGGWLLAGLFLVVVIGGIVAAVVLLNRDGQRSSVDTPSDIVKQRYASGDITKEQFDQILRDLK